VIGPRARARCSSPARFVCSWVDDANAEKQALTVGLTWRESVIGPASITPSTRSLPRTLAALTALVLLLWPTFLPTLTPSVQAFRSARLEIIAALDAGRYDVAERRAAALVVTTQSAYGPESFAWTLTTDLLVEARVLNGRGARTDTRNLAERIVLRKESWLTPGDPGLAPSVRNLGAVLLSAGEFTRAVPLYERALALTEAARSHPERVAESLSDLGYALTLAERHEQAESILDRAILLLERRRTPSDLLLASALERKGSLLLERGLYGAARPVLERALAIAAKAMPDHPKTARVLDTFGNLCWFEGNRSEAERYYRTALDLARRVLGSEHPSVAVYMRDLAASRASAGYLEEAQDLQERALAINRKIFGDRHVEVAFQLNDLANTRVARGDYAEARKLYELALDLAIKHFGSDHLDVATFSNNVALLYAQLGEFDQARDRMDRAVEIWQRVLGPGHPYVGYAFDSLAEVFSNWGRFEEARRLYERALDVRTHALEPDHRDIAQTLTSLADTLGHLGDLRQAADYSHRAVQIWNRVRPSHDPLYTRALVVQAQLSLLAGSARAAGQFTRAIARLEEVFGTGHAEIAAARTGRAAALAQRGRHADALTEALRAEDIGREHVRGTTRYLAERQALFFAGRRPPALDIALGALRRAPPSDSDNARVLDAVIRSRALVLDELATRRRTTIDARTPAIEASARALVGARQRLANLAVQGPDASHPELYLPLLAQAQRDKEQAERVLAEHSVRFRTELTRTHTGLDDIRTALPPRTSLVSFIRYTDSATASSPEGRRGAAGSYAAFVLHAGERQVSFVPIGGAASLESSIARWRRAVSVPPQVNSASRTETDLLYRRAGNALRRRIWDTIGPRVRRAASVFVVPDGRLNLVSFASLPRADGGFLVEDGPAIHYLSAERDLMLATHRSGTGGLLAIGAPAFDTESLPARVHAPSNRSPDASLAGGTGMRQPGPTCAGFADLIFGPLPAARREVDEIASIWTGAGSAATTASEAGDTPARSRVLVGMDATEAAVKRLAPGHRVLHFATHGFFLGSGCPASSDAGKRGVGGLSTARTLGDSLENPLVRTGLALAGANRRRQGEREDGILTAEEVAGLDLDSVEWAVLSACDTGIGELKAGEGVLGLRRAFQIAGAHTVIMSLWAVDDESGREWMRALYDARIRQQLDTIDAVRRASVVVLEDRRRRARSTHPFHWAGFVAAGDWH
jgi:tetratricopeptide (TPR) repeat protein/CHAT domain-containing protein